MRTGAIFARGSCRALAWVLALGVAVVLSGGQAVAQTATVIIPDKLVLTPTSVDVDEGAGETFTVQLMTKEVASDQTQPTAAVEVTVTLARAGATDDAHFIVGGVDTEALAAGVQVTGLTWSFTLGDSAGLVDPADTKFVTVVAREDAGVDDGLNTLVFGSGFEFDHDGDAGETTPTPALTLSSARLSISENDNDMVGVTISDERELTVLEGGDAEEYTVVLGSEPEHPVMVKVAVTAVNANITASPTTLTFTGGATGNWNRKQTVMVTAAADLNTINGSADIKHTTESDDPVYHKISGLRTIKVTEIDSVRTVMLTQSSDMVMEGESVTITATLESDTDTPVTLGGDVTVMLSGKDKGKFSGSLSFTIAAGSTAGSTKLTAKQDTNEDDESVTLTASVSAGPAGIIEIPDNKITIGITDDDEYMLEADKDEVDEGDKVMLTVELNANAALETKVMIDLYRASGATVMPAEGQDTDPDDDKVAIIDEGEKSAEFTLTTAKDANDSNDEVIVARAMVGSAVVGEPVTIMVRDTQAAAMFTLSLAPDAIGEADGEAMVMLTVMADKAVSDDMTLMMAVDPAGTSTAMDPDDYSIMLADVMIEKGEMMGEAMLTVTPVADAMDEENETIVLNAWVDDAQVGNNVTLTIIDGDSTTFMLSGPSDMNLVEGFEYEIMVEASTPVMMDTTVMLMAGAGSTATDDDYMVEDIMIMAGETMGKTKLMVVSDDMADGGSEGSMAEKLMLYGMVGNMRTNELSFYIWDLAVPALPVIAQLLLAALMAVGGYRRYRRR